jgi:hypothetical protein
MLKPGESVALEDMIDKHSVQQVLFAIADICEAKAGHIAENWQDDASAKAWTAEARKISRLAERVLV